jgi:hypothetical protein
VGTAVAFGALAAGSLGTAVASGAAVAGVEPPSDCGVAEEPQANNNATNNRTTALDKFPKNIDLSNCCGTYLLHALRITDMFLYF